MSNCLVNSERALQELKCAKANGKREGRRKRPARSYSRSLKQSNLRTALQLCLSVYSHFPRLRCVVSRSEPSGMSPMIVLDLVELQRIQRVQPPLPLPVLRLHHYRPCIIRDFVSLSAGLVLAPGRISHFLILSLYFYISISGVFFPFG